MKKKYIIVLGVVILAALAVPAARWFRQTRLFSVSLPKSDIPFPKVGSAVEGFTLEDLTSGQKISLSDFQEKKAVIMNFWASWSPFAVDEMRDFAQIQKEYADRLQILEVNRAEDKATAERFAKRVEAVGKYPLLLDLNDEVWKQYKGFAMPTTFFIDREGIITDIKTGPMTLDEMRERVEKLLSKAHGK